MGRLFFVVQSFYAMCGIGFFVKDLFDKVPMGEGMVRAFIWPYAQWPFIKFRALEMLQPVLSLFQ
tara:strand:+ start:757 stop:951 length:195 start_codon:yes stop_codon:yes gene_type:complete